MAETVVGTRTKLELVSKSHGIVRVPLAQSFDYTPRYDERTIFEFDNNEAALVVTSYNGAEVRFDYFDSDSKLVDAMLNDVDPGSAITVHDPSILKGIHCILNVRNEDGKIFQSIIAKSVRVRGVAAVEPVREESRITVDGTATNVLRLKGAGLLYSRILASVPAGSVYLQAVPPNSDTDQNFPLLTPWEVTLDEPSEEVEIDNVMRRDIMVLKNGVQTDTGWTLTATKFTLTSAPATTDVWEVVTAYLDP
jgi:hypothetical protein